MAERTDTAAAWIRPLPGGQQLRRDVYTAVILVLATALSAFIYASITTIPPAPWWVTAIWVVAIAAPLAVRRRFPAVVSVVVAVAFVAGQLLMVPEILFSNICLFVALYSLGAWGRNRAASKWVRLAIIVGMFLWLFSALIVNASSSEYPQYSQFGGHGALDPYAALAALQVLQNLLYFAAAYFFGSSSWSSAHSRELLQLRTVELQAEREHSQRQAVVLERVRIARELHDVVAHHVSVMGLQAGAARRVLSTVKGDADPRRLDKAVSAVTAIEDTARVAVDDLHRLLGALRQPTAEAPDPESSTTLDRPDGSTCGIEQLPQLVAEARLSGLPVEFSVVGEPRDVPPTTSLNVYRITQEALTNCRKHAGASAQVDARLRYLDDAIEIEVADDGRGVRSAGTPSLSSSPSSGLGQVGMRERVDAAGGILELGAKARGGYIVRARFPLAKTGALS